MTVINPGGVKVMAEMMEEDGWWEDVEGGEGSNVFI